MVVWRVVGVLAILLVAAGPAQGLYRVGNEHWRTFATFDEDIGLENGGHFSFYVRFDLDWRQFASQRIVTFRDAAGAEVLGLDLQAYALDQYGRPQGRLVVQPSNEVVIGTVERYPHRVDVSVNADEGTTTISLDQLGSVTVAETNLHAASGRGGLMAEFTFLRWTRSDVQVFDTFTNPFAETGWEKVEVGDAHVWERNQGRGGAPYLIGTGLGIEGNGPGYVNVRNDDGDSSLAFFARPVDLSGQSIVEVVFRPDNDIQMYEHHAVMAGLTGMSGPGEVVWAVTVSGLGSEMVFSLIDSAGTIHPLHVAIETYSFPWSYGQHTVDQKVRAFFDADAGTFHGWINEGGSMQAPDADLSGLARTERIAFGDVFLDHRPSWFVLSDPTTVHSRPSGFGEGNFDDIIVQSGWDVGGRDA